jgi:hypothetical protein
LRQVVELRRQGRQVNAQLKDHESQTRALYEDQQRIRGNMQQLDRTNELYQRYVKSLGEQENRIDELRQRRQQLRDRLQATREQLERLAPPGPKTGNDDPFSQ